MEIATNRERDKERERDYGDCDKQRKRQREREREVFSYNICLELVAYPFAESPHPL